MSVEITKTLATRIYTEHKYTFTTHEKKTNIKKLIYTQ